MLQANQKQVVQSANMTLIEIRTAEISYFSVFFNNFGLQTSIISGAICGSLSQTPALHGYDCPWSFVFLYFASAAAALTISIHAILSALFLIVYGNGYALRGPLGSMVQTIDGMIYEQHSIVFAFVFSMLFYVISMAGMFMVVMDDYCGPISFGISIVGGFITYSHCLRIFNRFRFINPLSRWAEDDESEDPMKQWDEDNPEDKIRVKENPGNSKNSDKSSSSAHSKILKSVLGDNTSNFGGSSESGSVNGDKPAPSVKGAASAQSQARKKRIMQEPSLLSRFFTLATSNDFAWQYPHNGQQKKDVSVDAPSTGAVADLGLSPGAPETYYHHLHLAQNSMEGYLTVRMIQKRRFSMKDPWSRKYVVLKGKQIFLYPTRNAFHKHPEQPVNMRPIHLDGFALVAGASEPPYAINLNPTDEDDIREPWNFRCDTVYEFESWLDRFTKALQLSKTDDLVVYKGGKSVRGGGTLVGGSVKGSVRGGGDMGDTQSVTSAVTTHSYL